MPGEEHPAARARVAESAVPQSAGPEPAEPRSAGDSGEPAGAPRPGSLSARANRPAAAALIAALVALAFTLVRWQTWAHGRIGRFILVGRHFATPSQLPPGMPVAKTYGYDGQFFYRLAINPLNFHHTAYGITMDRPYRFMRIGYPALTWLVSAGQHSLVPVMLVAVNIAAIGGTGLARRPVRPRRRTARAGRAAGPRVLRPAHQPEPGHRRAARRRLPAGRAARGPRPPPRAGRLLPRVRGADQGDGHGRRGRHRDPAGDRHAARRAPGPAATTWPGWSRRRPSRPGRSW